MTITFNGGTGDTLAITYSAGTTGDKTDTLSDTRTLLPGNKYSIRINTLAGSSGSATDIIACVRLKVEE